MLKFCKYENDIVLCDQNTIDKFNLSVVKEITEEEYAQNDNTYYVVNDEVHLGKSEEEKLKELRLERESECFSIINRGQLWYDNLTLQQREELKTWYEQWLDVTETRVMPTKPEWLE